MEKKFLSGVSLFDFLAMVIPGGLILAIVGNCLGYTPLVICVKNMDKFFVYLVVLVASYLVGIICNALIEYGGDKVLRLRNDPVCTTIALRNVGKKTGKSYLFVLDKMLGNDAYLLNKVGRNCICGRRLSQDEYVKLQSMYYEAYYYVATHPINSSISIMEGHVAFMRNMLIPLFLVIGNLERFSFFEENICGVRVWMCISCVFILLTMWWRQNKIYRRVWEDYIYLKYLENEQLNGKSR